VQLPQLAVRKASPPSALARSLALVQAPFASIFPPSPAACALSVRLRALVRGLWRSPGSRRTSCWPLARPQPPNPHPGKLRAPEAPSTRGPRIPPERSPRSLRRNSLKTTPARKPGTARSRPFPTPREVLAPSPGNGRRRSGAARPCCCLLLPKEKLPLKRRRSTRGYTASLASASPGVWQQDVTKGPRLVALLRMLLLDEL
jgi:hypothetical protein